mgnify:CR=1 FL=1
MLLKMSAPVYRSLLEPKLIFGVPYELGMLILLVSLYLVMLLGYLILPPIVVGVIGLRLTISLDPFSLKLYKQYRMEGDVYLPVLSTSLRQGQRTASTGKGMLC